MRILGNDDLRPHVGMADVLEAYETVLREYFEGDAARRPRIDMWSPTSNPSAFFQWGSMEGISRHYGVFATRLKSDIAYFDEAPDGTVTQEKYNTREGLYCGLILVFSIENGAPLAFVHDGYLQHLRVGAKAGLAVREGAVADASVVGMLGSGGMARSHLAAFDLVRDVERVRVYSPTPAHRRAYAEEMEAELDVRIEAVDTPRRATEDADIIACCTDASEPVLEGEWIPDGAFVTTVKPSTELADSAWERIDHLLNFSAEPEVMRDRQLPLSTERPHAYSSKFDSYAVGDAADYAGMPETTGNSRRMYEQPLVQFGDVLAGTASARADDDQVLSYGGPSSGQGLQFAAVGGLACEVADEHDLGRLLPNEVLLESVRN